MIIDDMNGMMDDIKKMLKSMGIDPNIIPSSNPNIDIQGFVKGPDGKVQDISAILNDPSLQNATKKLNEMFNGFFGNDKFNNKNKPTKREIIEKSIINKNFLVIQKILELYKNRDINEIFNSLTRSTKNNEKILKENNYTDEKIYYLIERYGFDLTRVKNVKQVLQGLMLAIKKGQLII